MKKGVLSSDSGEYVCVLKSNIGVAWCSAKVSVRGNLTYVESIYKTDHFFGVCTIENVKIILFMLQMPLNMSQILAPRTNIKKDKLSFQVMSKYLKMKGRD